MRENGLSYAISANLPWDSLRHDPRKVCEEWFAVEYKTANRQVLREGLTRKYADVLYLYA